MANGLGYGSCPECAGRQRRINDLEYKIHRIYQAEYTQENIKLKQENEDYRDRLEHLGEAIRTLQARNSQCESEVKSCDNRIRSKNIYAENRIEIIRKTWADERDKYNKATSVMRGQVTVLQKKLKTIKSYEKERDALARQVAALTKKLEKIKGLT